MGKYLTSASKYLSKKLGRKEPLTRLPPVSTKLELANGKGATSKQTRATVQPLQSFSTDPDRCFTCFSTSISLG